jgi:hypothetical protein
MYRYKINKENTHNVLKCFQLNINEALQKMTDP